MAMQMARVIANRERKKKLRTPSWLNVGGCLGTTLGGFL
jgi:hypothetical protein